MHKVMLSLILRRPLQESGSDVLSPRHIRLQNTNIITRVDGRCAITDCAGPVLALSFPQPTPLHDAWDRRRHDARMEPTRERSIRGAKRAGNSIVGSPSALRPRSAAISTTRNGRQLSHEASNMCKPLSSLAPFMRCRETRPPDNARAAMW